MSSSANRFALEALEPRLYLSGATAVDSAGLISAAPKVSEISQSTEISDHNGLEGDPLAGGEVFIYDPMPELSALFEVGETSSAEQILSIESAIEVGRAGSDAETEARSDSELADEDGESRALVNVDF